MLPILLQNFRNLKKQEVISELEDVEHAKDIVDLLRYDEDTAGGFMGKELVKVNENWNVLTCVKEMRIQAENVSRVHSIYVVDDENQIKRTFVAKRFIDDFYKNTQYQRNLYSKSNLCKRRYRRC